MKRKITYTCAHMHSNSHTRVHKYTYACVYTTSTHMLTLSHTHIHTHTHSLIVLDEIDQLVQRGQEVLYTLFEWPSLPGSKVVLVGMSSLLTSMCHIYGTDHMHITCASHCKPHPRKWEVYVVCQELMLYPGIPLVYPSTSWYILAYPSIF